MDRQCENYGSSWCTDFGGTQGHPECDENCPVMNIHPRHQKSIMDRLLTEDRKPCWSKPCPPGHDCFKCGAEVAVKAVIEEIEVQKHEICDMETYATGRSICPLQQDDDCNNPCRFMSENCRWWQQFKERNGIK